MWSDLGISILYMGNPTLRFLLLLLVVAMSLPLAGAVVWWIHADRQQTIVHTKETLRTLAKTMASRTGGKIESARRSLEGLAGSPGVRRLDPQHCVDALRGMAAINPDFVGKLAIANLHGAVMCSAAAPTVGGWPAEVGQTPWFQRLLAEKRFVVGAPLPLVPGGRRLSVLGAPIWSDEKEMIGAVLLPLELAAYDPDIPIQFLPEGSRHGFFADDGIMIWRNLDPEQVIGTRPDAEAARRIVAVRDGEFEELAVDQVRRFFSVVPMPEVGWVAFVGVPAASVYGAPNQRAIISAVAAFLVIGLLILLVRAIAKKITGPIAELERASREMLGGKRSTAVSTNGPREIAHMAHAFNAMIDKVERSTHDLEAEIAEHRQTENALRASEQRFHDLFERSPDPCWLIQEHKFIDCNLAAINLLGYPSRDTLLAAHPSELSPALQPDGRPSFEKAEEMMQIAVQRGLHRFEWEHRRCDGTVFPVEVTLARIDLQGKDTLYCQWRDITERKRLEAHIRHLAFYDPLTGLPNRRLLNDRLDQAIETSKRSGCFGALLLLDLDNFKPLNDLHGHEAGDTLLIEAANRMKSCVRKIDTVCRLGGDEFVVLISELEHERDASATEAAQVAEKLRAALAQPYSLQIDGEPPRRIEHQCSSSMGIVLFQGDGQKQELLLRMADHAMYLAKAAGRNQVRIHEAPAGGAA